jgi:Arc/MetJ-type ribon-helix-helix transcriptional regulator
VPQVNVRLPDPESEAIDRLVEEGRFANRTALVIEAIRQLLHAVREQEIAEAYRRAYADQPDDEGAEWAAAKGREAVGAMEPYE